MAKKRTMYRNTRNGEIVSADEVLASHDPSAYVAEVVPASFKISVMGISDNEHGKARLILDVDASVNEMKALSRRLRLQVKP